MDPPPPLITISDPNAPSGTSDLLDHGRDPWRPTRRQGRAMAGAVLATALIGGGVAQVRHVRHEHALDAAAVRDVGFTIVEGEGFALSGDEPQLTLATTGRLPVRVLDVALVWPQHVERAAHVSRDLVASAAIPVTAGKDCRTALYTDQPRQLRVRARTARGDVVTRTVELPVQVAEMLGSEERFRCEYLRPEEALLGEVTAASASRAGVELTVAVRNMGAAPLTLSRLEFLPGVLVGAHLPLVLPPGGHDARSVPLHVTLRVTGCSVFARSIGEPQDRLSPYALSATVSNPYVSVDVPGRVPIASLFQRSDGVQSGDGLSRRLAGTCPSRLFPDAFLNPPPGEVNLNENYSGLTIVPP